MRWNWCEMCRFDRHCENQDRNIECACYAREQTLRAEQYENLIDEQQEKIKKLKKQLETAVNALKPYQCHKLVFKCTDGTELEFEGSFKGSENINLEELNP